MPKSVAKRPTEMDKIVGKQVKAARRLKSFSQTDLAEQVSVTFQQIQKYEKGYNRVSAGMLFKLSQVLDQPLTYFYDMRADPIQLEEELSSAYSECLAIIDNFKGSDKILTARAMLNLVKH